MNPVTLNNLQLALGFKAFSDLLFEQPKDGIDPDGVKFAHNALQGYAAQRDNHLAALSALGLLTSSVAHLSRQTAWDGLRWLGSGHPAQLAQDAVWAAQRRYVESAPEPALTGPRGPRLALLARLSDLANEAHPDADLLGILANLAKAAKILGVYRRESGMSPQVRECLEEIAAVAIRLLEEPRS